MVAKTASKEVFLEHQRAAWFTLDKPDFKFNAAGVYGVGVKLDEAAAEKLNAAIESVEKDSGETGKRYNAGEVLKANMDASRRDRKTGGETKFTPAVYMPDLQPATAEDIAKLSRRSKFTIKVRVRSYPPIGEPDSDGRYQNGGRAGGVSVKFSALRIDTFDAGELSAAEQGFSAVSTEEEPF